MPRGTPLRRIHFDGCSLTRWSQATNWRAIAEELLRRNIEVLLSMDVLLELFRKDDEEFRDDHMRPLRVILPLVRGTPTAADMVTSALAADFDLDAIVFAQVLAQFAVAHARVPAALVTATITDKTRWHRVGQRARATWVSKNISETPSFANGITRIVRDWSHRRAIHAELVERKGRPASRPLGKAWTRQPSARCWALGVLWHVRAAALESNSGRRRALPSQDDLAQLVALPNCDAFVSDDTQLRRAATDVRALEQQNRPPIGDPWIGSFSEFVQLLFARSSNLPPSTALQGPTSPQSPATASVSSCSGSCDVEHTVA